jgi:hypothetical protein
MDPCVVLFVAHCGHDKSATGRRSNSSSKGSAWRISRHVRWMIYVSCGKPQFMFACRLCILLQRAWTKDWIALPITAAVPLFAPL